MLSEEYEYAYCLSCHIGMEAQLCLDIRRELPRVEVLYPLFEKEELRRGAWHVCTYPLMPGYVLAYVRELIDISAFYRCTHLNRLLRYGAEEQNKIGVLKGTDLAFADWIYRNEGKIGISQAMQIGDNTQIVGGPLVSYEGKILKFNRKKRCALVSIFTNGESKNVWLSVEWMRPKNGVLEGYKQIAT